MRSHGVPNFPDPQFQTGPGGGFGVRINGAGIDPNSPAFQVGTEGMRLDLRRGADDREGPRLARDPLPALIELLDRALGLLVTVAARRAVRCGVDHAAGSASSSSSAFSDSLGRFDLALEPLLLPRVGRLGRLARGAGRLGRGSRLWRGLAAAWRARSSRARTYSGQPPR